MKINLKASWLPPLILSLFLPFLMGGCSAEQLKESLTIARSESAAIRADLEAVAATEGADAPAAKKLAELAAKWEAIATDLEDRVAAAENTEDIAWAVGEVVAGIFGFGGLVGVLERARRRTKGALTGLIRGIEAAKGSSPTATDFTVDKNKLRAHLADQGILSVIEDLRFKE